MPKGISLEAIKTLKRIRNEKIEERDAKMFPAWKAIAPYVDPHMGDWDEDDGEGDTVQTGANIYSAAAIHASNLLANGIHGMGFGRTIQWFKYNPEDEKLLGRSSVMDFLQDAERIRYLRFARSNFYNEGIAMVKCCADYSTAIMVRNTINGRQTYKTLHLKRCVIDEDCYGNVDTLFYDFYLDAYQARQEYGEDNLPKQINEAYESHNGKKFRFTNYIFPVDKYGLEIDKKIATKGKDFASITLADCEDEIVCRASGYKRKNFYVWRWLSSLENTAWGTGGPGLIAVGDVLQANGLRKDFSRQSQLASQPPVKGTDGLEGRINFTPRGFTGLKPGEDFVPVNVVGNLQSQLVDIQSLEANIARAYQTDVFMILSQSVGQTKTATEVQGIQGEKAALLSAFLGRLMEEFLEPAIEDGFQDDLETGALGEAPELIRGTDFKIDMVSPLAELQAEANRLTGPRRFLSEVAAIAQINSEALDTIDLDAYLQDIAETYHVSKKIVRDQYSVERIRQARAQAQAQMMNQQMQQEGAKTQAEVYSKTSKAPEPGSPAGGPKG